MKTRTGPPDQAPGVQNTAKPQTGHPMQDPGLGITEELCPEGPGGQHQGVPSFNSDPTPNTQCDDAHFTDEVTEAQGGEGTHKGLATRKRWGSSQVPAPPTA